MLSVKCSNPQQQEQALNEDFTEFCSKNKPYMGISLYFTHQLKLSSHHSCLSNTYLRLFQLVYMTLWKKCSVSNEIPSMLILVPLMFKAIQQLIMPI